MRQYAPVIDVVRCAAALLVALFHFCTIWPHGTRSPLAELKYPFSSAADPYLYFGFVGVEIFFVISGYVIAASSIGRAPRAFLISRAMRLLPILWLSTAIGVAILIAFGTEDAGQVIRRALFTAALVPGGPHLDVVVWTLVVEVIFYGLIWALLASARQHVGSSLIGFARIISVASLVTLAAEQVGYSLGNLIPTLLLLHHGAFFAMGIFIWAYGAHRRPFDIFAIIAVASCLLEIFDATNGRNIEGGTSYTFLLPAAVWALAVAAIMYGATHLKPAASRLVRMAGLMTYPIYLTHQTVGGAVIALAHHRLDLPFIVALALGFAAVLLVSATLVELVEPRLRPGFLRGMERLVPGRSAARILG